MLTNDRINIMKMTITLKDIHSMKSNKKIPVYFFKEIEKITF